MNFTQLPALGPNFPSFCRLSLWEGGSEERRRGSSEEEEEEGEAEEDKASAEKEDKSLVLISVQFAVCRQSNPQTRKRAASG